MTRTQVSPLTFLALLCVCTPTFSAEPEAAPPEQLPEAAVESANAKSLDLDKVTTAARVLSPSEERASQRKMVFAAPPTALEIAANEKLMRDETLRTLELLSSLDGFHCRITEDCLSRAVSKPVGLDVAFQDVVLGVPVFGHARVDGALSFDLQPSKDHVSFDIVFAGTVALKGTGRTQDVQIRTDTVVEFNAIKHIHVNQHGVTGEPATCRAKAAITTKDISSSRPRILGKFSERIAQRRTSTSKENAEAECAEHLAAAISEHLDREVAAVATVINAAVADHLKAADDAAKARWTALSFNTADEWVHVTRASAGKQLPEFATAKKDKAQSPLVLQLPRARLDVNVVLTGMRYLQQDSRQPAASSHVAVRQPVKFRPVVELGSDVITFRFEFDEPAKLAHDAPLGKVESMP